MWIIGWGMGLPDPSELVSSLIGTDAPSNFHGYSNARVDELGAQAISEADP
jgi:ABC-type transport system substrate-binding protein